jgi:hypothetical protein
VIDKLGENYSLDVYWLKDCEEAVKIDDASMEFGKFFNRECYVIHAKSEAYSYMICWQGPHNCGEMNRKCSAVMDQLQGGIFTSRDSRVRMPSGSETGAML